MTTLGERVKRARETAGLGTNELDEKLGLKSKGYTSRIETGLRKRADKDRLRQIADITKVDQGWLMFGTGAMRPPPASAPPPAVAPVAERTVERDPLDYAEAEIVFAEARAAGVPELTIDVARKLLGSHKGKVTAAMAVKALKEAIARVKKMRTTLRLDEDE